MESVPTTQLKGYDRVTSLFTSLRVEKSNGSQCQVGGLFSIEDGRNCGTDGKWLKRLRTDLLFQLSYEGF